MIDRAIPMQIADIALGVSDILILIDIDIQLHFLNFSAINGLHSISIVNLDKEDVEFDLWRADLDVDENDQMVSAPFGDLERVFQNKGVIPLETVT